MDSPSTFLKSLILNF